MLGKTFGFVLLWVFVGAILSVGYLTGGGSSLDSGEQAAPSAQTTVVSGGRGINAESGNSESDFDIVHAAVSGEDSWLVFQMHVRGEMGATTPDATGDLPGSEVYAYVWPTSIDPADVGFTNAEGILALVVTSHPDFDDTPQFDEDADGESANDGAEWHSHWVVLGGDEACGEGGLKVLDIPKGAKPGMPSTWPGLPLMIDSPGYVPNIGGGGMEVRVPLDDLGEVGGVSFDAVTSSLRINQDVRSPLLCVSHVFDIASGDLSLPGKVN